MWMLIMEVSILKEKLLTKMVGLALASFGWYTLVYERVINEFETQQIIHKLTKYIFNEFEAPKILTILDAAPHEIRGMSPLCGHPTWMLLTIGREFGGIGIM